jgi:BclB C-terminal domain-containing protein
VTGATGVTGVTGATGAGAIIPFASGEPVTLSSNILGLPATQAAIGFGSNAEIVATIGGPIGLAGGPGLLLNEAFSMPRDGTITSISAYFSTVVGLALTASTVTITASVYISTTPDNTFVPVATVALVPSLTGIVPAGTISNVNSPLAIPVAAEDRVLVVFSAVSDGLVTAVEGYASAGLGID